MILALFLIMVNGEAKLCCKPPFVANGGSTAYFNWAESKEIKEMAPIDPSACDEA